MTLAQAGDAVVVSGRKGKVLRVEAWGDPQQTNVEVDFDDGGDPTWHSWEEVAPASEQ